MTTQGTGEALQGFDSPDNAEVVSTETPPIVTEQEPEGEVNWQERYELEVAARTKAENDFKSQRNGRQSADSRQEVILTALKGLEDEQSRQRLQSEALMGALASGDPESLPAEVAKINQEHQAKQSDEVLVSQANALFNRVIETVVPIAGDRDAALEMINTQPEFQNVRDNWTKHIEGNIDLVSLSGVVADAAGVAIGMSSQKAAESVRVAEEKAADRLEAADVMNLDVGSGSSASQMSDEARNLKLSGDNYSWSADDTAWYENYRREQGRR